MGYSEIWRRGLFIQRVECDSTGCDVRFDVTNPLGAGQTYSEVVFKAVNQAKFTLTPAGTTWRCPRCSQNLATGQGTIFEFEDPDNLAAQVTWNSPKGQDLARRLTGNRVRHIPTGLAHRV